jgi:hypothetical protein
MVVVQWDAVNMPQVQDGYIQMSVKELQARSWASFYF